MSYTTVELVSQELNGVSITASTVPSTATVTTWIDEATSEIDIRTGKVWSTTLESDSIVDYDGTGFLRLPKAPVLSITKFEYEKQGLGATTSTWTELTEGRTNNFILHIMDGELEFFGSTTPTVGTQNIKVTYTAGYSTTPAYITRLATLVVAKRFIQSVVEASAKEEGGSVTVGNISITDPTNFGANQIKSMDNEVTNIIDSRLGNSRIFRPSRNYSRN